MGAFEAVRLPDPTSRHCFVQAVADLTDPETDLLERLQEVLWMPLLFEQQLNDLQRDVLLLRERRLNLVRD